MAITFFKSKWEMWDDSLPAYFERCKKDGFQGAELGSWNGSAQEIKALCGEYQLRLFSQVATSGASPKEHEDALKKGVEEALRAGTETINCHLGSDFFSFSENTHLFSVAADLSRQAGIPILQETHRGRPLYNLPDILRFIEELPGLELTADISHLMCVHESDLNDRWDLLEKLVPRCRHVHARVGFQEGPQVNHPLAPEWSGLREIYLKFWKMVLKARGGNLTVTPEAGPAAYMPTLPFSKAPVADAWTVNVQVRDWLKREME